MKHFFLSVCHKIYLDIFPLSDAFIAGVSLSDWEHRLHNPHYKMRVCVSLPPLRGRYDVRGSLEGNIGSSSLWLTNTNTLPSSLTASQTSQKILILKKILR